MRGRALWDFFPRLMARPAPRTGRASDASRGILDALAEVHVLRLFAARGALRRAPLFDEPPEAGRVRGAEPVEHQQWPSHSFGWWCSAVLGNVQRHGVLPLARDDPHIATCGKCQQVEANGDVLAVREGGHDPLVERPAEGYHEVFREGVGHAPGVGRVILHGVDVVRDVVLVTHNAVRFHQSHDVAPVQRGGRVRQQVGGDHVHVDERVVVALHEEAHGGAARGLLRRLAPALEVVGAELHDRRGLHPDAAEGVVQAPQEHDVLRQRVLLARLGGVAQEEEHAEPDRADNGPHAPPAPPRLPDQLAQVVV
mmetsp:Transcript_103793/g.294034  ORF Transcript_103793/g.294034 Transcript_103793/m.294034 type:complete len:311 (-) Transcript_103793:359-1291(-)